MEGSRNIITDQIGNTNMQIVKAKENIQMGHAPRPTVRHRIRHGSLIQEQAARTLLCWMWKQ